jgi:NhaA family Na+:H+ antiporter
MEPSKPSDSYYAPFERAFGRVFSPFEEFIHEQTSGGLVLMACAVLALVVANSPLANAYSDFLHLHIKLVVGPWVLDHTIHHWINDGLMALFFFLVGLEIKREVLLGDLSDPRAAALPVLAAIGGMVFPALVFAAVNFGGEGARGWGIPMATDIAFAVGVLSLLGARVPRSLFVFLVALAIVDDLGAVAVIAFFYTEQIDLNALALAGAFLGVLIVFNLGGIRHPLPHFAVGCLLWLAMLESGVHATVAGVLAAWTVPSRAKLDPERFTEQTRELFARWRAMSQEQGHLASAEQRRTLLQAAENSIHKMESPLQRLEHAMHVPCAFVVIPLFALANAGVPIELASLGETLASPVTLGVMLGLLLGKMLGIAGVSLVAVKLGIGQLPAGCRRVHIFGAALLAAIGFTMSIFIAEMGFRDLPELLIDAKTGILLASIVAGSAGYLLLRAAGNGDG